MPSQELLRQKTQAPLPSFGLAQMVENYLETYFKDHGELLPASGLYERILREIEKPLLLETLKLVHGNQVKASEILGIHRNTLRKKMQDLYKNG
ncbi:MAG: helix-turn-helix domain-containing protein [Alphaproteobacteria bacterium]